MKRYLALIGAAVLAVSTASGSISAQTGPVNADGSYAVADDDGVNTVSGQGDDIVVGEINSGGGGGEVLGDPNFLPDTSGAIPVVPGAGDGIIAGIPVSLLLLPDVTTTTTPATTPATSAGIATETIPVAAPAPTDAAPVTTDSTTATGGFCTQYPTWYDAQLAYENLGGTAADPALVQEVDPNVDGIACEEYMA
jgi:hypothetical protein